MPVVGAVVCPHPPLLVPAVAAGAAAELEPIRASCRSVVADLLVGDPDVVVVVGDGPHAATYDENAAGNLHGYGVDVTAGSAAPWQNAELPLAHTIGAWLLDGAGWTGRRRYVVIPADTPADAAAAIGRALAGEPDRLALVVMGDGSARRSTVAPGYLDARAGAFDATVAGALAAADGAALLALDAQLATDLLAAGRASWHVLGGALVADTRAGSTWCGRVVDDAAPYGVGYVVAALTPTRPDPPALRR